MLVGKKVILRAWREEDLALLLALRNDAKLQAQLMTQPRPNSVERVKQWLSEKSSRADGVFFVVATQEDDQAIGYVQALNMNMLHGHADFGICLSSSAQGQGYGRETLTLLESYLHGTFALRKLMLQVLVENTSAIAFYRNHGFTDAGLLSGHFYLNGRFCDVAIMEKLLLP